jgi:hypothetical protein
VENGFNKFLVVKWDWIEETLGDNELNTLYGLLAKITESKPEYRYYVVNTDEPYSDKIKAIVEKGDSKISRAELIARLKELATDAGDAEAVHAEADELLLDYLNDPEIEKVFEEVPKWYA